ncbi:MAG: helix-turn-helix transcriptional regulator, partial [Lachnospiraceae bacterium]|nr:helix-turn-helix transcriptional regulator [Lachnospiraceae bacterium]
MSRQIARQLCSGALGHEEILTEMLRVFCPSFIGETYIVLGVVSEEPKKKIIDGLTGEYPFSLYMVDDCKNCSVISFVVGLKCREYSTADITEMAEQLACFVDKSGLTHLFIVTGRAYQSYFDMNKSFDEMLTLAYYVLSEGCTKKVNIFQEEMMERRTACIGDKGVILLKGALQKRDVKEAEKVLCQVRDENGNREDPILQRFQGYVLLQLLYEILSDMGVDSQALEGLLAKDLDEKAIKNILKLLTKVNVKPVEYNQEIIDYINHNYKDSTLNLDTLAVRFHKSVSVISRDIKKLCGQNYTDYISELRLEEACRLLRETSMSVQDITFEVGYMDKASFRRKFKAKTGVLPGEYRMAYKEIDD